MAALPPELRAHEPPEARGIRRDQVRLLVIDRSAERIIHTRFDRIGEFIGRGDVLVMNASRTLPAALPVARLDGSIVQLRICVRHQARWDMLAVQPDPPHQNVGLACGEPLWLAGEPLGVVRGRRDDLPFLWIVDVPDDRLDRIVANGEPVRYSYVPAPVPLDRYQTVYAGPPGSAESPSAGRPFSWELLLALRAEGVARAEIVLHTGLSSFQDDAYDAEHHLYEEWFSVPECTAVAVRDARRVIAVGTTVVRALESAWRDGAVRATQGWTDRRVSADATPRAVDALLTGMHERQASHFELLEALVPRPLLERAYVQAVERRYLWHEFGDATLIL